MEVVVAIVISYATPAKEALKTASIAGGDIIKRMEIVFLVQKIIVIAMIAPNALFAG